MMNRRNFAGLALAAVGGVFVPRFGRWYRRGSGLLTPPEPTFTAANFTRVYLNPVHGGWREMPHGWEHPQVVMDRYYNGPILQSR